MTDIAIIGAGPAGVAAALTARARGESGYLVSEYPDFLENFRNAKEFDIKVENINDRIEEINQQLSALMI